MKSVGNIKFLLINLIYLMLDGTLLAETTDPIKNNKFGSIAEWAPPKIILMHSPGTEQFLGILHPQAALFEKPFNLNTAAEQHKNFVSLLEKEGAKVYKIKDVFLKGTMDSSGNILQGKELEELRNFATNFIKIDSSNYSSDKKIQDQQDHYKNEILSKLSPENLFNVILLSPTIYLSHTDINTGAKARYEVSPLMNLMFLRDHVVTTKKGIILGKMNSKQRLNETKIVDFALKKLGIPYIYKVDGDARLEGGDFISAGDVSFIGQGLRTNEEAIHQLLVHKAFGTKYVVVVKDSWKNQQEMHLDTYFNIINAKTAVLSEWRIKGFNEQENKSIPTVIDVYKLSHDQYQLVQADINFVDYLSNDLGMKIIPVPREEQEKYGINFLTISPHKILAINGVSENYKKRIADEGIEVVWMDFSAITSAYGAAHCVTQPILRSY